MQTASPPPRDEGETGADSDRLWLPLNALRAFEAVARELSFTNAAAALHVSQSALSRHVARLEELLGRKLLERRPNGLVLTAAGQALLPVVSKSFNRIEACLEALQRDPGGATRLLRVHMPPTFLSVFGLSLLRDFRASFPVVLIDVTSSNSTGLPPSRQLDVAVVFDRPQVDDTVRDVLWLVEVTPACAPDVAAAAAGRTLSEFLRDAELLHTKIEGERFGSLWAAFARGQKIDIGSAQRGLAFETEALAVQWAVQGGGVMLVDPRMVATEIAAGRLVAPFEARLASGYGYYLALHPDDIADPAVSLFRSFVIQRFA